MEVVGVSEVVDEACLQLAIQGEAMEGLSLLDRANLCYAEIGSPAP